MADPLPVLSYAPPAPRPRRWVTVGRAVVCGLLGGIATLFVAARYRSSVDNPGLCFAFGFAGGACAAVATRDRHLPRLIAWIGAGLFLVLGGLIGGYCAIAFATGISAVTGQPFFGLGDLVMLILLSVASAVLLLLGALFLLLRPPHRRAPAA